MQHAALRASARASHARDVHYYAPLLHAAVWLARVIEEAGEVAEPRAVHDHVLLDLKHVHVALQLPLLSTLPQPALALLVVDNLQRDRP